MLCSSGSELPITGVCKHACAIPFLLPTPEHPLSQALCWVQGHTGDSGLFSAQSRNRMTKPRGPGQRTEVVNRGTLVWEPEVTSAGCQQCFREQGTSALGLGDTSAWAWGRLVSVATWGTLTTMVRLKASSFKEVESRKSRVRALDPDSLGLRSPFYLFHSLG